MRYLDYDDKDRTEEIPAYEMDMLVAAAECLGREESLCGAIEQRVTLPSTEVGSCM